MGGVEDRTEDRLNSGASCADPACDKGPGSDYPCAGDWRIAPLRSEGVRGAIGRMTNGHCIVQ